MEKMKVIFSDSGRETMQMKVFGFEAQQETVYAEVSPLVISVLDGYNACIFAYGQVGSLLYGVFQYIISS